MEVTGMNHFTVLTKNLASSVQFYAQTLWLSKGPRPGLSFPGAWLYCNGGPIVHLISSDTSAPPFGVIDHMAFNARDLPELQQHLQPDLGSSESGNAEPAINRQDDTGHIGCVVGAQEARHARHIARRAPPLHRNTSHDPRTALRVIQRAR